MVKKPSLKELKEQRRILEKNIKAERNMVKSNKSYTNSKGQTFTPSHYKQAALYDKYDLKQVKKQMKKKK